MLIEEAAEIILKQEFYIVCPGCQGTGQGQEYPAQVLGMSSRDPDVKVKAMIENLLIKDLCVRCIGAGSILNPRYLKARNRVAPKSELPPTPRRIYNPSTQTAIDASSIPFITQIYMFVPGTYGKQHMSHMLGVPLDKASGAQYYAYC